MFKKREPEIDYEGVYFEIVSKKIKDNGKKTEFDTNSNFQVNNVAPHLVFAIILTELKNMCKSKKINFYEYLAFNEAVDIKKLVKTMQKKLDELEERENNNGR